MAISKIQNESINRSDITGSVLQTKSFTLTSATTISSNSFLDTGLELAITPSSTSSKILITGFINCGAVYFSCHILLVRDSTSLSVGDAASSRPQVYSASHPGDDGWDSYATTAVALNFLDSPNTTSSVTYKVQCKAYNGASGTASINRSTDDRDTSNYDMRTVSVITLQEIAA
jgi:hypothetical protein